MPTVLPSAALVAPAVARNREPILAALGPELPGSGLVLEIASGSGEHAVFFAAALPGLRWQPTDRSDEALASVAAHRDASGLENLLPPRRVDAASSVWPLGAADAVVAINMIHIAPWAATLGLFAGASRLLPAGGPLCLYGPFRESDRPTAPSNEAFDVSLRDRDPAWGLRDLGEVLAVAARARMTLARRVEMPANNLALVFRKASPAPLRRPREAAAQRDLT